MALSVDFDSKHLLAEMGIPAVNFSYPNSSMESSPSQGTILRVFLVPQDKGRSRNFDYVGGTALDDPDAEQYVFCRGRPTVVPFAIGVQNCLSQEVKLKVQVIFSKIKNKVPVRCSNHKEGDNTIWRDQLMISTDPLAQALPYQEGHGFMIDPAPSRCDAIFLCRNSCRQGYEKDWQLQFTLLNKEDQVLAIKYLYLRVCEVPHRDMMKSKVKYEWDSSRSAIDTPVMKSVLTKTETQQQPAEVVTPIPQDFPTDVYPIYVSGYSSYCEIMKYVSNMEMRKKHEHPVISQSVDNMRDWNKETPVVRFLQLVCGLETSIILDKFIKKGVHNLGDLHNRFTPEFFPSLQISETLASSLSALYLNWRNIMENYELTLSMKNQDMSAL